MYYHQKDVTVHSNHPVESNYEYNFNNDNGYVGMNEVYERNPMQTTQRFPVQNGSSPMGNGGVSYNNEFAMSRTSNYKSSSGVPENMRLVDSEVASQRYVAPRSNKRETTKVIRETLEDGTVISRQIVVEEEDTLIERRLYKYEATSPLMSRKMDPAQAMAVQTGVHQAAEYAEDDDDITAKFSRYEAELEARRQQQQQQQQRKTHDDVNGWGSRYGSKGGNLEGSGTEEGHYVEGYGPVSPNEGSSLRKSDISKISPSTDAVAKSAPPRQMRYNESFKHASNNAFFGSDDLKPSPRSNQFEHLSHHRNDRSGDALISPGGRMDSQRPSESHYTYDLPGGSDFNRNNKQNGHLTTEPYQGKRESGFTTTHGFPLLSGRQKSTPDISQHLDNDYVPNYDNTHLVAKQRGFKMSADNLIDEDSVVARDASRSQQNAGLDFAPRPSPKPKLLPLQKHHAPQSNKLTEMVLEKSCGRCLEKLQPGQDLITSSGEIFHKECFVCAACFRPFPDGVYYDFDNRKYCEEDFNLLFAPNCQACGDFVKGRVIKAMGGKSWHAECFVCSRCETPLADTGFHTVKSEPDKPYCKPCSEYMMKLESGKRFCGKCHAQIENDGLRIKDEWFHAYHFNCTKCNAELTPTARESEGKLYCLKCSDSRTCALCRRTIEKFERSLVALNKSWHPDCFRCSFCDKPFNGDKHFVYNAQPYCEEHYNQLFGNLCFYCNRIVPSPGVSIEQKIRKYCEHHFECFFCGKSLTPNTDVVMLDSRPVCMKCTQRFPGDFKNQCFKNRGVSIGASLNPKAKLLNPFKKK
ncbi:uncharacterized protein LOC142358563 isoform X3 [Convolutriloba macropyga]|uniref:uncharacterized protein LOC142358563 isoform X3 n=1 Tax=Convolutriloba macropyga TaxID=536237 RepID=UPI003F5276A4